MNIKNPLIIALDTETLDEAKALVTKLGDSVEIYKIGSQLFTAYGPQAVREITSMGKKVFLDLKFHDIPNTVAKAVESAMALNVFMMTIHTVGGKEMMTAAVDAAKKKAEALGVTRPLIVGVTVLTSTAREAGTDQLVLERARLAQASGLDGVVASVEETAMIRKHLGNDFIIVTPGIRPTGSHKGDQQRIATPKEAMEKGSSYLVVGRPIVAAASPVHAAQEILNEIQGKGSA